MKDQETSRRLPEQPAQAGWRDREEPPMACVYAGPERFGGREERSGEVPPPSREPPMGCVYAGPPPVSERVRMAGGAYPQRYAAPSQPKKGLLARLFGGRKKP